MPISPSDDGDDLPVRWGDMNSVAVVGRETPAANGTGGVETARPASNKEINMAHSASPGLQNAGYNIASSVPDYDLNSFGGLSKKFAGQLQRLSHFAELLRERADLLVGPRPEDASTGPIRPVRSGIVGEFADKIEALDSLIEDLRDQETRIACGLGV